MSESDFRQALKGFGRDTAAKADRLNRVRNRVHGSIAEQDEVAEVLRSMPKADSRAVARLRARLEDRDRSSGWRLPVWAPLVAGAAVALAVVMFGRSDPDEEAPPPSQVAVAVPSQKVRSNPKPASHDSGTRVVLPEQVSVAQRPKSQRRRVRREPTLELHDLHVDGAINKDSVLARADRLRTAFSGCGAAQAVWPLVITISVNRFGQVDGISSRGTPGHQQIAACARLRLQDLEFEMSRGVTAGRATVGTSSRLRFTVGKK